MANPTAIGVHRVWRSGDIVGMQWKGVIRREDIAGLRVIAAEILEECGLCFLLSDMSACTGIEAEARKYMALWSKEGVQKLSGTAVYGVSFPMRALVTLTLNAIRFIGAQQVEVVFVKDEAEAHRYAAKIRAELGVGDSHGAG